MSAIPWCAHQISEHVKSIVANCDVYVLLVHPSVAGYVGRLQDQGAECEMNVELMNELMETYEELYSL